MPGETNGKHIIGETLWKPKSATRTYSVCIILKPLGFKLAYVLAHVTGKSKASRAGLGVGDGSDDPVGVFLCISWLPLLLPWLHHHAGSSSWWQDTQPILTAGKGGRSLGRHSYYSRVTSHYVTCPSLNPSLRSGGGVMC